MTIRTRAATAASKAWRAFDGLAEDTLWSAAMDGLALIAAVVSFTLLQEVLTIEQFGGFAALFGLASIFSAVTYSGPGLALIQRRFRFNQPLNELQPDFLSLTLLAGVASTVVAVVLAVIFYDGVTFSETVLIIASELIGNSTVFVCGWLVQAAAGYPSMMRVRIGSILMKLIAVPTLFLAGQLNVRNLGATYFVLYVGYSAWLVFRHLPRLGYRIRFRRPPANAVRSSGVFAAPLAASQVQIEGDKITLKAFGLDTDVGLYAAAYRVVLLGALPLRVVGQAAFHRFLTDDGDGSDGFHLRRAVRLSTFMFAVGWVAAGAIYGALRLVEPLIDFLIKPEFAEAKSIIPWLVLFLPLLGLSGTPLNGLLGLGRTNERAAVYLSSAAVSVVLYLTLIPNGGWEGAVVATLVSETYLVIASWVAIVYYQRVADRDRRTEIPVAGVGSS